MSPVLFDTKTGAPTEFVNLHAAQAALLSGNFGYQPGQMLEVVNFLVNKERSSS